MDLADLDGEAIDGLSFGETGGVGGVDVELMAEGTSAADRALHYLVRTTPDTLADPEVLRTDGLGGPGAHRSPLRANRRNVRPDPD